MSAEHCTCNVCIMCMANITGYKEDNNVFFKC